MSGQGGPAPGVLLLDRYRLEEWIGGGGMGEVWRATDQVLGRTVAVKLMRRELAAEPGFAERFLAEARTMATIKHRGVVAIHDFHGDESGAFLVMEYIEGQALAGQLHQQGRLAPPQAMELLAQAADALQAAHNRGVVHRDIKPGNLLVASDGTLVLTDFGIARSAAAAPVTATGAVIGTPAYLSPEQVLGKPASARSDLYALGVVAYECLTGRRPFDGDNPFEIAIKRLHGPPPEIDPAVPPAVVAVVNRALATDPDQRWQSAAEFATVARQAVNPGASAPPTAVPPAPTRHGFVPGRAAAASPPAAEPTAQPAPAPAERSATPAPGPGYYTPPPPSYPTPPPWAIPPTRPMVVMAASLLLCLAAAGIFGYSAVTLLVLEDALALTQDFLDAEFADAGGAAAVTMLVAVGLLAILGLLFLLLSAKVAAGRGGARGWTFVLGLGTVCCGGPCWWYTSLDTLAGYPTSAPLAQRLAAGLPGWYEPLVGLSAAVIVGSLLVAMGLLMFPAAGRYFRRPRGVSPYPYYYPYYGYPPRR